MILMLLSVVLWLSLLYMYVTLLQYWDSYCKHTQCIFVQVKKDWSSCCFGRITLDIEPSLTKIMRNYSLILTKIFSFWENWGNLSVFFFKFSYDFCQCVTKTMIIFSLTILQTLQEYLCSVWGSKYLKLIIQI